MKSFFISSFWILGLCLLGSNTSWAVTPSLSGGTGTVNNSHISEGTAVKLNTLTLTEDFTPGSSVTISFNGDSDANIQFDTSATLSINAPVLSGPTITTDQISFTVDRTGEFTLTIDNLEVYWDGITKTVDTERLKIDFTDGGTTNYISTNTFTVHTHQIFSGGTLSGDTGINNVFIVGDDLCFVPPTTDIFGNATSEADITSFVVDVSGIGGTTLTVDPADPDCTNTFDIPAGNTDNAALALPVTTTYTTTDTSTFNATAISLDNAAPAFADGAGTMTGATGDDGSFIIGDILVYTPPTVTDGDVFVLDFSSIGGNGSTLPEGDGTYQITITEGVDPANPLTFPVNVDDNAGNEQTFQTEEVTIDRTRPSLPGDTELLTVVGGGTAKIGSQVTFAPTDLTVRYTIDLSSLGGPSLVKTESETTFTVTSGNYNNEAVQLNFTVYDDAGNASSAAGQTTAITVDNALPTFNTADCGGTFALTDVGDSNNIADLSNGGADTLTFTPPNNTHGNCDFTTYSIGLSSITGDENDDVTEAAVNGADVPLTVGEGTLDGTEDLVLTVYDGQGNSRSFTSGSFVIDNQIPQLSQSTFRSAINGPSTADGGVILGGTFLARMTTDQTDISSVSAFITGATDTTSLGAENNNTQNWSGTITVKEGSFVDQTAYISFSLTDDAGNITTIEDTGTPFVITNDNTKKSGGNGGSRSFNVTREGFQSRQNHTIMTPVEEQNTAARRQRLETPSQGINKTELEGLPIIKDAYILHPEKTYFDAFKKEQEQSKIKKEKTDPTPNYMKKTIKKLMFPHVRDAKWKTMVPKESTFKVRNTLEKLTNSKPKTTYGPEDSLRKSRFGSKKKYGFIHFE